MTALLEGTSDHFADLPGLRMHYVTAGPEEGPPVVLLHGFPEFWYSWRFQIPALAAAGYRVIAPDQRGYNLTEKQGPYTLKTVTDDIKHLLDHLHIAHCAVVGHDWGGPPAWALAAMHRDRVRQVVAINGPHPNAFIDALRHHPGQLVRSAYMMLFQLPVLPEAIITASDFAIVDKLFAKVPKDRMTPQDIDRYKDALNQRGALTAMLGWYRALGKTFLSENTLREPLKIDIPACVIWGEKDPVLEKGVNDTLPNYARDLKTYPIADGSHWVQMERPDETNHALLNFLNHGLEGP